MNTTIDADGRVTLPEAILRRMNLTAGSKLEVRTEDNHIRLTVPCDQPMLTDQEGILVFRGEGQTDLDIAEFINRRRREHTDDE